MISDIVVHAEPRPERGKNAARRLRAKGLIPAILYGAGKEPVAITVDPKVIEKILYSPTGHNTIFTVEVDGTEKTLAMVVDWQYHPVTDRLLHVDLQRVDMKKPVRVRVPVHLEGEPVGVKQQGGLLDVVTREVEIECLPGQIPEHLAVDISSLRVGRSLRAQDVPLPEGVKLLTAPDTVICHIAGTRGSEAEQAGESQPQGGSS